MRYRRLFFLVEGADDELFAQRVLAPQLQAVYPQIDFFRYAQRPKVKLEQLLRGLPKIGAEYLLLADLDRVPCVVARRAALREALPMVDPQRIVVVAPEIEAWFLAGLSEEGGKRIKLTPPRDTNAVTKEQLDRLLPPRMSRIDFLMELIKDYRLEDAAQKNRSLGWFFSRRLSPLHASR